MPVIIDRSHDIIGSCPECGSWAMRYRSFAPGVACDSCGADTYAIVSAMTRQSGAVYHEGDEL